MEYFLFPEFCYTNTIADLFTQGCNCTLVPQMVTFERKEAFSVNSESVAEVPCNEKGKQNRSIVQLNYHLRSHEIQSLLKHKLFMDCVIASIEFHDEI